MNKLKLYMSCFVLLLCGALFAANEQDVIASVEYFYAQDGTLIGRAINGVRQNFEYDKRGQLLAVKDANGRDLERYTYDPAGNRLSKTVNGITTTYTYDEANQLKTSTVNGETTHYRYDAAGRLVQAGGKTYYYFGANDKVTEVRQGDKVIAEFDYFMDGQIARAKYPDREEHFTWDGLALVQRSEVSYLNEPYVTGGNPILSSRDGVMFNDMLGSTLNIGGQPVSMTSFGESADDSAFFTGKPMIPELGYAFLFRDYNPAQGKWTSSDPLGYPDGWNQLAYCNNGVTISVDWFGAATIGLHGRPVKNTFGTFTHTSTHINVNQQEYDSLSKEKQSKFTKLPDGTYRSIVSGFDSGSLLNPNTYLDLRYNDSSDEAAVLISNITNPNKNAMQLINDYLDQAMKYEQHETETDYDWFPNDPDEGNSNALQGTILDAISGNVNNVPSNATGFDHRLGGRYFE